MFFGIARAEGRGKLRYAVGKKRDAADVRDIPLAAMLEGGRHPVGIVAAFDSALLVATPENSTLAAIRLSLRAGHPTPLARRGLAATQIGDIGIGGGKQPV